MSILYFPNRVFKKSVPAIDRVMAKRDVKVARGCADLTSTALDETISSNSEWHLDSIKFTFSNTVARNYSAKIIGGAKVLTDWNDYLWFQVDGSLWQKITLDAGFYTGTQLATELQTQLNANAAFVALARTFTVSYNANTGIFTVSANTGKLRYIQQNNTQRLPDRDSIAGHLFGFTEDTVFTSNVISSNTPVFGMDQEAYIINEVASVVTEDYNSNVYILSIDQALHLTSNTAGVIMNYEIGYEEIV